MGNWGWNPRKTGSSLGAMPGLAPLASADPARQVLHKLLGVPLSKFESTAYEWSLRGERGIAAEITLSLLPSKSRMISVIIEAQSGHGFPQFLLQIGAKDRVLSRSAPQYLAIELRAPSGRVWTLSSTELDAVLRWFPPSLVQRLDPLIEERPAYPMPPLIEVRELTVHVTVPGIPRQNDFARLLEIAVETKQALYPRIDNPPFQSGRGLRR